MNKNFVKLTESSMLIFVKKEEISSIHKHTKHTTIYYKNGLCSDVEETVEQIFKLMEDSPIKVVKEL